MKIGKITINSKLALAPMAGVTDLGFRTVCRELGAGYTVTEMVSAKALCYQDKKSLPLLELGGGEHPAAVQLFGSDPYCMEQAAGIAAEKSGADILDINMGCPVPKVANSGDGSGLMRNPELAVKVAEAVIRGAGGRPVTVKFRLGWDKGSINCVEFAQAMEAAGVAAVAVHGRTKVQMYSGRANWDYIRASNLTARDEEEILCRQIIVEGIMAIQSGENPKFLRERLMTFMNQKLREGGESGGGTGEKKERKRRKEK